MKKFLVTEDAMRPASPKRQCFYCQQNIGAHHKDDCVLVKRKMTIRFSFDLELPEPAFWDGKQAEFFYNEGSWCSMNIMALLEEYMEQNKSCLCELVFAKFISQNPEEYLEER